METKEVPDANEHIPELNYSEDQPALSMVSKKVQPQLDVVKNLKQNLAKLVTLANRQIPSRAWDEPATESSIFRHFCIELQTKLNQIPATKENPGTYQAAGAEDDELKKFQDDPAMLCEARQIKDIVKRCKVDKMFENLYGGGVPLGDFLIEELSKLRCRVLSSETNVQAMMQPQHYPGHQNQPHRPINMPANQNMLRGPAAGQYIREQQELKLMSHPFREAEVFSVKQHQDAYAKFCRMSDEDFSSFTNTEASAPAGEGPPAKEGGQVEAQVKFSDIAHQWKIHMFSFKLLNDVGIDLNVYNSWFFCNRMGEGVTWETLACFLLQVLAPLFILQYSIDRTNNGLKFYRLPIQEYIVILLFNTINCRVFMKQVRNFLLTDKLRSVVWASQCHWKSNWHRLMDFYANVINTFVIAIVINLVLFTTDDVLSAILDALALNFVVEIDEYVLSTSIEDASREHVRNRAFYIIKFLLGQEEMGSHYELNTPIEDEDDPRGAFLNEVKKSHDRISIALQAVFIIVYVVFLGISLSSPDRV